MSQNRDEYGLVTLMRVLDQFDKNSAFDPVSRELKWNVTRAAEYAGAREHSEAVASIRRARDKLVHEAKIEVNTGLTKMTKLPRVVLNLMSDKAAQHTGDLGQNLLKVFQFAIANVAATKVLIGEDREKGTVVVVMDDIVADDLSVRDLIGMEQRVHINVPASDLAGHGTTSLGVDLRVRHLDRALREIGLVEFAPHSFDNLRNAKYQVHDQGHWSRPERDMARRVGETTKVRFVYHDLPPAVFRRPFVRPAWVPELFRNLNKYAQPEPMNPHALHPANEAVYQFANGIDEGDPNSRFVTYAGKRTLIPSKGKQPVTYFLFHPALGAAEREFEITEESLRTRLRVRKDVRCLLPHPLTEDEPGASPATPEEEGPAAPEQAEDSSGHSPMRTKPPEAETGRPAAAATDGDGPSDQGDQSVTSGTSETNETSEPSETSEPNETNDSNEDLEATVGLEFRVPDELGPKTGDLSSGILDAGDGSYHGIRARVVDAAREASGELTVTYHLTVSLDSMLHTNTQLLVNAHRAAEPSITGHVLERFHFVGLPIKGRRQDARDYKINLMSGRDMTVVVSYRPLD